MGKSIQIMLNDLRVYFADRGNIVGLVVLPVALTLLLGAVVDSDDGPSRIAIDLLDFDQSEASANFIDTLRNVNETLVLCPLDDGSEGVDCGIDDEGLSLEEAQARVSDGAVRALIVIPEGYQSAIASAEPITIDYYSLATATTGDLVLPALQAVVQRTNGGVIAGRVAVQVVEDFTLFGNSIEIFADESDQQSFSQTIRSDAESLLASQPMTVDYRLTQSEDDEPSLAQTQGFGQAVPGQGTLFVMFTVLGAMSLLLQERKQWTLQRLVVMPVSRAQILGGKILAYFSLGMIQYAVVFGVGIIVGTQFGNAPLALLLVMVAFTLSITALTFALATFVTSEGQAQGLSLLLSLTLAPLGGAWWPLEITPQFMQVIGRVTPVAWAMDGFRTVIFFGGGLADVLLPVAVLLGMASVFFVIGIYGFRYDG